MRICAIGLLCLCGCAVSDPIPFPSNGDGSTQGDGSQQQDASAGVDSGGSVDSGIDGDSGVRDAAVPCQNLGRALCAARRDCAAHFCADCDGNNVYNGCTGANDPSPVCPGAPCPAACNTLAEGPCKDTQGCDPLYCQNSCTGDQVFEGCFDHNQGPGCPGATTCDCAALSEAQCLEARDCHRLYAFAPTNILVFQGCEQGASAMCQPPDTGFCEIAQPFCPTDTVLAYDTQCYVGCVFPDDCQ